MTKHHKVIALVLVVFFAGCSIGPFAFDSDGITQVQVKFKNATDKPLDLFVNGPGVGVGHLGPIPPGGHIITLITVDNASLRGWGVYSYTAGDYAGNFLVCEGMNPLIEEVIPEGSPSSEPPYRHPQGLRQAGEIPVKVSG